MIGKMVNMVSEQGNYWVANNFIWGWLLIPVTATVEIIKTDSKEEVEKYFKTPEERIIKGYEPTYYWWTSSKREGSDYNACLVEMVDWKGEIACQGHSSFPNIGVRVACLINV